MIRAATIDDFLQISELDRVSWKDNRNGEFIPDGEHVWRIWCEHAIVGVADLHGSIGGVVLAFPCRDGTYCLHKIFVDRQRRGVGLGIALMDHILRIADDNKLILFLTVDPGNAKALALYRSSGFAGERLRAGYYRSSEDRLVLTRAPTRRTN